MPTKRSVDNIKSKLLQPALTSHYEVEIPLPPGLQNNPDYLSANGLQQFIGIKQESLNLMCCETSLPGSNIGTMDITGDYHGVTVRHANRRIYDDRIDMTFYVDAENYLAVRYFEVWMKYVVGESITGSDPENPSARPGSRLPNYYYRLNYPDLYISKQGLKITKFERNYSSYLQYEFINAFPISVSSMPISYEASSLLKCTVSFSYIRYILYPSGIGQEPKHLDENVTSSPVSGDPSSPANQAIFNNAQFGVASNDINLPGLEGTGALNIGGIPQSAAKASGNTVTQQDINSALSAEAALQTR